MAATPLESLIDHIDITLQTVVTCALPRNCRMLLAPQPLVVVHFVLEGDACFEIDGAAPLRASPGSAVIVPGHRRKRIGTSFDGTEMPPSRGCSYSPDGIQIIDLSDGAPTALRFACGYIGTAGAGGLELFGRLSEPLVEDLRGDEAGRALFALLLAESRHTALGSRAMLETIIKQSLILALRNNLRRGGAGPRLFDEAVDPRLLRAIAAVLDAPGLPHSTSGLADIAGMSRSAFSARFSGTVGTSPMEYVQHVRLERAAQMLKGSGEPVKRIASDVGFASRSHFSRAFRERFGVDPSAYRAGARAPAPELLPAAANGAASH